jgi:hypothetical protein
MPREIQDLKIAEISAFSDNVVVGLTNVDDRVVWCDHCRREGHTKARCRRLNYSQRELAEMVSRSHFKPTFLVEHRKLGAKPTRLRKASAD